MIKSKYLYIDDENDSSVESIIKGFNDINNIEVERFPLSSFKEFGSLKNELKNRKESKLFDGLIIDLRLDGEGPDSVEFSAIPLASELRSITARGDIQAFPIILCSTHEKIKQTYNSDKTSQDLFDYTFEKSINPTYSKFSNKLFSLAEGYNLLNTKKQSIEDIFGRSDLNNLDNRIFERFRNQNGKFVVYDYAHFTVKNLFHCTNPLLKNSIVAARLGIDIQRSGKCWSELTEGYFDTAKYKGLFANGWKRWWADLIIDIFKSLTNKKLSFLTADERVQLLKEKTGITGLVPALPIKYCKSNEFWTICEGYKKPLDPLEGFKIQSTQELKSWQESKYLSLDAILERIGIEKGLKPHSSELQRIEELKRNLS